MNTKFSIINAITIKKIVNKNKKKLYDLVELAYIRIGEGKATNPPSYFLRYKDLKDSRIIALPALIEENPRIAGIKWISSNPENCKIGLMRASAVIVLNDYDTGYPLACMEGAVISSLRTVYSAILVANLILQNKKDEFNIGIVGAGNISKQFINNIDLVDFQVGNIKLYDLSMKNATNLKGEVEKKQNHFSVSIADSLQEVIDSSDLVFLATTASKPYIFNSSWFKHNPIVLNISLRDLSPDILIISENIVDDIDHILTANTSPHLTQQKYGNTDFINCNVYELICGYNNLNRNRPIIFSPMGMGILDLVLANYVYNEAVASKNCIQIDKFFENND